jgi:p-aminobenzoyl-glutamate transporter AbgT
VAPLDETLLTSAVVALAVGVARRTGSSLPSHPLRIFAYVMIVFAVFSLVFSVVSVYTAHATPGEPMGIDKLHARAACLNIARAVGFLTLAFLLRNYVRPPKGSTVD